ncbi:MAG: hypothetical protein AAGN15_12130 [Cyanobacteria bacterium J06581_3]
MVVLDSRRFVLQWTVATSVAIALSTRNPLLSPWLVGIAQWLVLRRYHLSRSWLWIAATAIGNSVAIIVAVFSIFSVALIGRDFNVDGIALFLFACVVVAIAIRSSLQCWILSRYSPRYPKWIAASTAATVLGCSISVALIYIFYHSDPDLHTFRAVDALPLFLIWGLGGAIIGLMEGRSLNRILN